MIRRTLAQMAKTFAWQWQHIELSEQEKRLINRVMVLNQLDAGERATASEAVSRFESGPTH